MRDNSHRVFQLTWRDVLVLSGVGAFCIVAGISIGSVSVLLYDVTRPVDVKARVDVVEAEVGLLHGAMRDEAARTSRIEELLRSCVAQ